MNDLNIKNDNVSKHSRIQISGTETKNFRLRTSDSKTILIRAGWGQPEDLFIHFKIFQI